MRRKEVKIYSERFPLKYLFSNHGLCLGVDTWRGSLLVLACRRGLLVLKRPVGDLVVENNNYDIPLIWNALIEEDSLKASGKRRY